MVGTTDVIDLYISIELVSFSLCMREALKFEWVTSAMEANFSLATIRQQQCFHGKFIKRRLYNVFKIEDHVF